MDLKCGHMQQVNSDTTLRPMRPVSDTKLLIPATAVAAPSYESAANGGPVVSTQTLMSQCDTSCTGTTMSQMSQPQIQKTLSQARPVCHSKSGMAAATQRSPTAGMPHIGRSQPIPSLFSR